MKTTDTSGTRPDHLPRPPQPEQRPWDSVEDTKGWTRIYRGRGKGKMPLISVQVDFDRAQSEWLRAESARTGFDYATLVGRLIEAARSTSSGRLAEKTPDE